MVIEMQIPSTTGRVKIKTGVHANQVIRDQTIKKLSCYLEAGDELITKRIKELEQEWDAERLLQLNAGLLVAVSALFGFVGKKRKWSLLAGATGYYMLKHALDGWCPPLPLIRALGIRTQEEINQEKIALKKIRGDFEEDYQSAEELLDIAQKN